ncbi:MAG: tRNA (N6-isopentenyl adenosine(37)-C2)-methylthiotransferase MiaB [Anaerolineae bacterium]|nr:tRNA (N6-isopentenyl adenosine(37)-C2)-methylthiotransferase MiaB [Anaerolineae bacterium]
MKKQRYYYLWNIGCQMNRADAWRVAEGLEKRGLLPTRDPSQADILVLNTCVVRQSAENKVIGRLSSLRSLKRSPQRRLLLVMGCFVDDPHALRESYPFVDAFFKPSDIAGVLAAADQWLSEQREQTQPITPVPVSALVPISYGCDRHCTYCIVTLRRGPQQSRPLEEIVAEVQELVQRGAREITLLGQNVDAYGTDLPNHPDLADILYAIHDIKDLWRIRFLTSHPKDMTQRIIQAVAELPKVCECWELPVQSGDDVVLRRMARGYTVAHFRKLVQRIRQATPQCAINTDIIVGFPGETITQFKNTLRLLEEIRFDVVHVAAYSVRPGTPAARWEDDVPPEEKERRRSLVEELQTQIASEINAKLLGQEVEILVDGKQRGRWRGRTRTNKLVFFESAENWLGRLARVRITWTGPWSMLGEPISEKAPLS